VTLGLAFARAADNARLASSVLAKMTEEDQRTDAEFSSEVAQYIRDSREHYARLAIARLSEQGASQISVQLVNASDRNYADARVELVIPAGVYVHEPEAPSDLPEAPKRPRARGARVMKLNFGMTNSLLFPYYTPPAIEFFRLDHDESGTTVTYDAGPIRAEQRISLNPAFTLVSPPDASGSLEISWSVTASNVDGIARGDIAARISDMIDAAELIPELLSGSDR
jgi:hypothetical protein